MVNFQVELHFCPRKKCSFSSVPMAACQNVLFCTSGHSSPLTVYFKGRQYIEWNFGVRCISYKRSSFIFHQWWRKEVRGIMSLFLSLKWQPFRIRCLHLETSHTCFNNSFWNLRFPGHCSLALYLFRGLLTSLFIPATVHSVCYVYNKWRVNTLTSII